MRSFTIEFKNITDSDIPILTKTMIENPKIDEVIFLCVGFENDVVFHNLLNSLVTLKKMRAISLQNIVLTANMCTTIRHFIQTVEEVRMDYCQLSPEADFSLTYKENSRLRHLSLSHLKVSSSQLEAALESIKFFPMLSSLNLSGIHLKHLVAKLSQLLKRSCQLITLDLSATVSDESFLAELSGVIANHQQLRFVETDAAVTNQYTDLPAYFLDVINGRSLNKEKSNVYNLGIFKTTKSPSQNESSVAKESLKND